MNSAYSVGEHLSRSFCEFGVFCGSTSQQQAAWGRQGCCTLLCAFFVDDVVGAASDLERFGVLLDERVDMAHALAFENLVHGDEDARLLDVAEAVVDGGAE